MSKLKTKHRQLIEDKHYEQKMNGPRDIDAVIKNYNKIDELMKGV